MSNWNLPPGVTTNDEHVNPRDIVEVVDGDLFERGARTDDEWETYIREASVEHAIIERGKRWSEFFDECHDKHGKQGGSRFAEFADKHFGISKAIAALWVRIGRASIELFDIVKHFSADYRTIADFLKFSPEVKSMLLESGELIDRKAIKSAKAAILQAKRARQHGPLIEFQYAPQLHCCSIADIDIQPGCVDAIITDPPYPREFLPLYATLAERAAVWLKPGGSLVVMCGHIYLPEIFALMTPHIRYNWTVAYLMGTVHASAIARNVRNIGWKPVLHFVNGENSDDFSISYDVIQSPESDTGTHHKWGQSVVGIERLLELFSHPNQLVVDPFLGGGTTAYVAAKLGRRFIGCDIDEQCITTTRERLNGV